jgi:hypothetical protein
VTESNFHTIEIALLLVWAALGIAFLLTPSWALKFLTRDRVTLSGPATVVARVLGAVNAFGALYIVLFGW